MARVAVASGEKTRMANGADLKAGGLAAADPGGHESECAPHIPQRLLAGHRPTHGGILVNNSATLSIRQVVNKRSDELSPPATRAEILVAARKTFEASRLRRGWRSVVSVVGFPGLVGGAVFVLTARSTQNDLAGPVAVFAGVIAFAAAATAPDGEQLNLRLESVISELRLLRAAQFDSSAEWPRADNQMRAEDAVFEAISRIANDAAAHRGRRGAAMARDAAVALHYAARDSR